MKVSQLEEIIRNTVRKKLSEATIDVNNPAILTSQAKQQLIIKARNSTKNQKIGTADDPAEFIEESGTGDPNISQMSRAEMISWLGMTPKQGLPWTDGELRNAMYDMTQDIEQEPADGIDEADYFDVDDNTIIEDDEFSDYNNIYERMKKIVTYKG
jgi:hypothetical protein